MTKQGGEMETCGYLQMYCMKPDTESAGRFLCVAHVMSETP